MNVAIADPTIKILVVKTHAVFLLKVGAQAAIGRERWRLRQQHTGQVVEIAQRVAGEFQPQVNTADVERVADRAAECHPGVAGVEVALQRERRACAAQGQHAADFTVTGDRLVLVAALQRQAKDVIAHFRRAMLILRAGHFAERQRFAEGIDKDGDIAAGDLVIDGDSPAVKENIIEAKGPAGGRVVARRTLIASQLKGPVIIVFRQADQPHVGLFQLDPRQVHRFAQQRQRGEGRLHPRQVDHGHLGDGRRVAQHDIFRVHMGPRDPAAPAALVRLPLPDHAEIAADGERSVKFGGHFLIDRRLQPVPVKGGQHDKEENDQQQYRSCDDNQRFTGSAHPYSAPFASRQS